MAIPSLTILISNMGDTIIKWFSDLTNWVASFTILPGQEGFRASVKRSIKDVMHWLKYNAKLIVGPRLFGDEPPERKIHSDDKEYENKMLDILSERLGRHLDDGDGKAESNEKDGLDDLERDIRFYHFVLALECRNLQNDLDANPPKQYEWSDWEYYLKLMGNEDDPKDFPGQEQPDIMVPDQLLAPRGMITYGAADFGHDSDGADLTPSKDSGNGNVPSVDGNIDRRTSAYQGMEARRQSNRKKRSKQSDSYSDYLLDWSWLSNASPLMSEKTEAQWILDRLSAALERELNRQRKGYRRQPPIGIADARRPTGGEKSNAEGEAKENEEQHLGRAERSNP